MRRTKRRGTTDRIELPRRDMSSGFLMPRTSVNKLAHRLKITAPPDRTHWLSRACHSPFPKGLRARWSRSNDPCPARCLGRAESLREKNGTKQQMKKGGRQGRREIASKWMEGCPGLAKGSVRRTSISTPSRKLDFTVPYIDFRLNIARTGVSLRKLQKH